MNTSVETTPLVLYVFDAYCGWCYGFSQKMAEYEVAHRHRVRFNAISGGLFVGERALPIGAYPHIPGANARIASLSGVTFGAPYLDVLKDGRLVMNSADVAAGYAALREQAPDRAIELVHLVQEAFYLHGKNFSDPQTFVELARKAGLDDRRVASLLSSGEASRMAAADFRRARELGVASYPTVLYIQDDRIVPLPATGSTLEEFTAALDAAMADSRR